MRTRDEEPKNDGRFNLYLPADLLEWVKVKAAKERRRPNAVIVEALEAARKREGSQ
jgi:hypothetical protein